MLPNIASEDWGFQVVGSENGLKLVDDDSPAQGVSRLAIHTKSDLYAAAEYDKILLGNLSKLRAALCQENEPSLQDSVIKTIRSNSSPVNIEFSADGSQLIVLNDTGELAYIETDGSTSATHHLAKDVSRFSCCPNLPLLAFVSSSNVFVLGDNAKTQLCNGELVAFGPGGIIAVLKDDNSFEIYEKTSEEFRLSKTLPQPTEHTVLKVSFGDESSLLVGALADFEDHEEPKIYISNNSGSWDEYDEACPTFGNDESAPEWYFVNTGAWTLDKNIEKPQHMVLFSQSTDTALVAKGGLFDLLDDSARATLPCNEDDELPLGVAIDFGSENDVVNPFPGVERIKPMPMVYCLTNSGRVVCWSVICKHGVPDSSANELSYSCTDKITFGESREQVTEAEPKAEPAQAGPGPELNGLSLGGSSDSAPTTQTSSSAEKKNVFGSSFSNSEVSGSSSKPMFGTKSAFGNVNTTFGSSWAKAGSDGDKSSSGEGKKPFSFEPAKSAFGTEPAKSVFGSGSGTTSAFGSNTASAVGSGTSSAFGSGTASAFGSGATSAFGSHTESAFGSGTNSAFGSGTNSAFGSGTNSAFGSGNNSAFGSGTKSIFGSNNSSAASGSANEPKDTSSSSTAAKPATLSSGFSQFASQKPGASAFGKFSESTSSPFASAANKSSGSLFGSSGTPFAPSESAQKSAFGTGRPIDSILAKSGDAQTPNAEEEPKQKAQFSDADNESKAEVEELSQVSSSAKHVESELSDQAEDQSELPVDELAKAVSDDAGEESAAYSSQDEAEEEEAEEEEEEEEEEGSEELESEFDEENSFASDDDKTTNQSRSVEYDDHSESITQQVAALKLEAERLTREAEQQSLKTKKEQEALARESEQVKKQIQDLKLQQQELEEQRLALEKLSIEKKAIQLSEEKKKLSVISFNCEDMSEDNSSLDKFLPLNHGRVSEDLGDLDSLWADVSRMMRVLDHNQRFLAAKVHKVCSDSGALNQTKTEAASLRKTLDGLKEQSNMLSQAKDCSESLADLLRQADSLAQALNAVFRENLDERLQQRPLSLTEARLKDEILKVKESAENTAREIESSLFVLSLRTRSKDTLPKPADLAVAADAVDIVMRRALAVVTRFAASRESDLTMNTSMIQPRGLGPEDFSLDETHFSQRRYSRKATRALAAIASQRSINDLRS